MTTAPQVAAAIADERSTATLNDAVFSRDVYAHVKTIVSSGYEHASLTLTSNLPFSGWEASSATTSPPP
jgi:hypothetical protein